MWPALGQPALFALKYWKIKSWCDEYICKYEILKSQVHCSLRFFDVFHLNQNQEDLVPLSFSVPSAFSSSSIFVELCLTGFCTSISPFPANDSSQALSSLELFGNLETICATHSFSKKIILMTKTKATEPIARKKIDAIWRRFSVSNS